MAATAVYTSVKQITRPSDGVQALDAPNLQSNIASTTSGFHLSGGQYGLRCKASTYGTVTLQTLLDDGVTWVTAATAFSADGFASVFLTPGTYRWAIA